MEQMARIRAMEEKLDRSAAAVRQLAEALDRWEAARQELQELAAYYESPQWRQDFADDEAGLLPADLKRGVLSEDAVYNLLEEQEELLARLRELTEEDGHA